MQKKNLNRITLKLLETIYTSVGNRKGWDFSRMKTDIETEPWDYTEIVLKYLKPNDYALDIGTGGGEKFIKLSQHFAKGIGIDPSVEMINTAKENMKKEEIIKVSFILMSAENLKFPNGSFDIVMNRHAVIVPKEITRVLKLGGYFITQQVEKNNMQNLKNVFKYKKVWKNDIKTLRHEFEKNGCKVVATGVYDVSYWVKDIESLVFWLKAVNLPENFTITEHGKQLLVYIKKYLTPKGFITNESRELFICKKVKDINDY